MAHSDVWDFYRELSARPRSTLNEAQRGLVAVCDLRQEVNSGGFDSYFRYQSGDSAADALPALQQLLGQDWADLLREAMELLGPDYPIDQASREARLDQRDLDDWFEDLDARYDTLEVGADADARLNDYLARTPDPMA
jgi:Domain of unknown function (DUF4375)